jgi:uncharacterized membrane protein
MSVMKVSTYIITANPIGLAAMLLIMSISTFKTDVILYVLKITKYGNMVNRNSNPKNHQMETQQKM